MAVSAAILLAALAVNLPTIITLSKARTEVETLTTALNAGMAEAQRAADSLNSQIARLQEEVTIARASIPSTAGPGEAPRYPSQETLAEVLRETEALPKVFDIGEGIQLTSGSELRSVLSGPVKVVVPDRAGDQIHLVVDRPGILSGARAADVQLFKVAGDSLLPAQKWQSVPLASSTGKVLLPIPQGVMESGDYVLTIMLPKLVFRSGVRSSAQEKSVSFHLSVQPKTPGNDTSPK